ncbi:MAG: DNA ligase [Alphaproteobacteria bacterium]|nr:DNA ligase [Alphaproteobacteria bacterium]
MRLELSDGKSHKFWEVEVDGAEVTTRWGRIGTSGQSKTKAYASPAAAQADADKQAAAKRAKGYGAAGAAAPVPASRPAPTGPIGDGDSIEVPGSGGRTYTLTNTGGVWSCTCPAWLHQSLPVERRTCKHLRAYRGEAAETARLGALPQPSPTKSAGGPGLLLAHSWDDRDPTGWWMSEKLDGVRALWDGSRLISRLGNPFHAPDWFLEGLPDHPLDGEIFGGRGRFQMTVSIARRMDRGEGWRKLEYVVFDAPAHEAGFEDRLDLLHGLALGGSHRVLAHTLCRDTAHLLEELARVEALGGEGVMLRRPGSRYVAGRSDTLLKVKTFHDAEARVVGHQPGTGRHQGRMGALLVELDDGTAFKVGTGFSDAEREDPPPVGTVITFRYQELTEAGVPRFPSFVRVRD